MNSDTSQTTPDPTVVTNEDEIQSDDQTTEHDVIRLVDPLSSGQTDTEPEMIGEAVPPVGLVEPEEAAMHYETDPT